MGVGSCPSSIKFEAGDNVISILHTADLHIDSPFKGDSSSSLRQQDLRDTFGSIVELAKANSTKLVLISGDLFDNEFVTSQTIKFLVSVMANANEIRFFISPGNHDYYSVNSVFALSNFPSNVFIFKKDEIECVEIEEQNAVIYGFGACSPHSTNRFLKDFCVKAKSKINIMLFHGNLLTANVNDNFYPLSEDEIKSTGLDYLALGHIHSFSGIKSAGNTYYAYPGCPEGRGFDELGAKGVILGFVGKERHNLSFVPVSKRRYEIFNLDITGINDFLMLKNKIGEVLNGANKSVIARVVLTGKISSDFVIDTNVMASYFTDVFSLEIRDLTTCEEDAQSFMIENTLRGLFVKKLFERLENANEEEKLLLNKALRFGILALNGEEVAGFDH